MRFLKRGTLRKVVFCVILFMIFYSVWTSYNVPSVDVSIIKKETCSEKSKNCYRSTTDTNLNLHLSVTEANSHTNSSPIPETEKPLKLINGNGISVAYEKKWVGFPKISGTDCSKAFNKTIDNKLFPQQVDRIFPAQFMSDSSNCQNFIEKYGFGRYPKASQEDLEFPIAFIILFYKDLDQVLFLLRALYHVHNVYCLSVDTKASIALYEAVRSVTKCLPNVILASKLESIVYAGFTRLMADINCMDDLMKHPIQWKYAINMPGQQFPLRTNLELVKILKMYNGANDIEGMTGNRMLPSRFKLKYTYVTDNTTGEIRMQKTTEKNEPPPHNLEIVKGSAYGTFSRAFVHFVLNNPIAKDFLDWCKSVASPDEYFWATLHHSKSLKAPGSYTAGEPDKKPWITTYASWGGYDPCATIHTRSVCIFSPADIPLLMKRHELFANKFYITHQPAALHCLDQLLFNLTFSRTTRDLSYYQNLPFALRSQ